MPFSNVPTKSQDEIVINKLDLRRILEDTQCPLQPTQYETFGLCRSWYFSGEMWAAKGDDSVEIIEFELEQKKRKAIEDAELMMAVDQYISCVHINKSHEIYNKLLNAREEAHGADDGNDENDSYQELIPGNTGRLTFLLSVFAAVLNGYFLVYGLSKTVKNPHESYLWQFIALLMGICEVYLYTNILINEIVVNLYSVFFKFRAGDSAHLETKEIAMHIKNLSALSLLRYMLSVELVTSYLINWKETSERISAAFTLACKSQENTSKRTKNRVSRIFAMPIFLVETLAPFLSVFGIYVKIQQLDFIYIGDTWTLMQWMTFFAFMNQIAGLRVLQGVEISTIQHFVFSGSDASMNTEELLLLDDWWNITLLSVVGNLQLNWLDNMVFWYSLDPKTTELLLKNHVVPETKDRQKFSVLQTARESDIILEEYDAKVFKMLKNEQKGGMALEVAQGEQMLRYVGELSEHLRRQKASAKTHRKDKLRIKISR